MSPHRTMISCKKETIILSGTVTKVILSSSTSSLSDTVIKTSSECLIPQACNLEKFSILKCQDGRNDAEIADIFSWKMRRAGTGTDCLL